MKKLILTLVGIILIIVSNTIINFMSTRLIIEPVLVYVIIISIYSEQNKYFLYFLSMLLGFLLDSSVSMYSGVYTLLFLAIMIAGSYLHDKMRKDYFLPTFILCLMFVLLSCIYLGLIYRSIVIPTIIKFTFHTMVIMAISIIIINSISKKLEK